MRDNFFYILVHVSIFEQLAYILGATLGGALVGMFATIAFKRNSESIEAGKKTFGTFVTFTGIRLTMASRHLLVALLAYIPLKYVVLLLYWLLPIIAETLEQGRWLLVGAVLAKYIWWHIKLPNKDIQVADWLPVKD